MTAKSPFCDAPVLDRDEARLLVAQLLHDRVDPGVVRLVDLGREREVGVVAQLDRRPDGQRSRVYAAPVALLEGDPLGRAGQLQDVEVLPGAAPPRRCAGTGARGRRRRSGRAPSGSARSMPSARSSIGRGTLPGPEAGHADAARLVADGLVDGALELLGGDLDLQHDGAAVGGGGRDLHGRGSGGGATWTVEYTDGPSPARWRRRSAPQGPADGDAAADGPGNGETAGSDGSTTMVACISGWSRQAYANVPGSRNVCWKRPPTSRYSRVEGAVARRHGVRRLLCHGPRDGGADRDHRLGRSEAEVDDGDLLERRGRGWRGRRRGRRRHHAVGIADTDGPGHLGMDDAAEGIRARHVERHARGQPRVDEPGVERRPRRGVLVMVLVDERDRRAHVDGDRGRRIAVIVEDGDDGRARRDRPGDSDRIVIATAVAGAVIAIVAATARTGMVVIVAGVPGPDVARARMRDRATSARWPSGRPGRDEDAAAAGASATRTPTASARPSDDRIIRQPPLASPPRVRPATPRVTRVRRRTAPLDSAERGSGGTADTPALGAGAERRGGSSPPSRTTSPDVRCRSVSLCRASW